MKIWLDWTFHVRLICLQIVRNFGWLKNNEWKLNCDGQSDCIEAK